MNMNAGTMIEVDFTANREEIRMDRIRASRRKIAEGLIQPATSEVLVESVVDHTSEPIKNMEDIYLISDYLLHRGRYRDNMLFICGINFGLRVSDLLRLHFSDLIDSDYNFKTTFPILEQKTKNTRKVKQNRYITINDAAMDAVLLYLEHTPGVRLDDYMFRSEGNRGKNSGKPLHRNSVDNILKEVNEELELGIKMSTHSMRKTWAFWQMALSGNDPRMLLLVQKMLGHSSSAQTLTYIGITRQEIEDAYMNLNLGARKGHPALVEKVEITEEEVSAPRAV